MIAPCDSWLTNALARAHKPTPPHTGKDAGRACRDLQRALRATQDQPQEGADCSQLSRTPTCTRTSTHTQLPCSKLPSSLVSPCIQPGVAEYSARAQHTHTHTPWRRACQLLGVVAVHSAYAHRHAHTHTHSSCHGSCRRVACSPTCTYKRPHASSCDWVRLAALVHPNPTDSHTPQRATHTTTHTSAWQSTFRSPT